MSECRLNKERADLAGTQGPRVHHFQAGKGLVRPAYSEYNGLCRKSRLRRLAPDILDPSLVGWRGSA